MLIDKELEFSDAQAIWADGIGTNIVDQGAAGDALEHSLRFVVSVIGEDDYDNLTDITFHLCTSNTEADLNTNLATSLAATVLLSKTVDLADLTAGSKVVDLLIPGGALQYLGVAYDINGTTATQGAVDAALVRNTMNNDFSA